MPAVAGVHSISLRSSSCASTSATSPSSRRGTTSRWDFATQRNILQRSTTCCACNAVQCVASASSATGMHYKALSSLAAAEARKPSVLGCPGRVSLMYITAYCDVQFPSPQRSPTDTALSGTHIGARACVRVAAGRGSRIFVLKCAPTPTELALDARRTERASRSCACAHERVKLRAAGEIRGTHVYSLQLSCCRDDPWRARIHTRVTWVRHCSLAQAAIGNVRYSIPLPLSLARSLGPFRRECTRAFAHVPDVRRHLWMLNAAFPRTCTCTTRAIRRTRTL